LVYGKLPEGIRLIIPVFGVYLALEDDAPVPPSAVKVVPEMVIEESPPPPPVPLELPLPAAPIVMVMEDGKLAPLEVNSTAFAPEPPPAQLPPPAPPPPPVRKNVTKSESPIVPGFVHVPVDVRVRSGVSEGTNEGNPPPAAAATVAAVVASRDAMFCNCLLLLITDVPLT
tara:strand:+ start:68 stop:580 length:513 start_codon:yes stop_codon:yes gene_type:complete